MGCTHHDDGGLVPVGGQAIGIGEARRQLIGSQIALVADNGAGRQAAVDGDLEGDLCILAGRDDAGARIIGRLHRQAADEGRQAADIRLQKAVQLGRCKLISRIGGHAVGEHHACGRDGARVADINGVEQGIARIHNAHRAIVHRDHDGLMGVQQGHVAHHVTGGIVGHRCVGIIRRLSRLWSAALAVAAHKTLVLDDQAVHGGGIDDHIENHGGHVVGSGRRIGPHVPWRSVLRGVDRDPGDQGIDAGTRIRHGITVKGGAVSHISCVGRGQVLQLDIDGILVADVFNGKGIAQGIAGHEYGRIVGHVR